MAPQLPERLPQGLPAAGVLLGEASRLSMEHENVDGH